MELKIIDELLGGMPSWTEEANCKGADADLFFPERGASTRKAKAICRACTVQDECLEYAVEQSEKFGIWAVFRKEKEDALKDKELLSLMSGMLVKYQNFQNIR